MNINGTHIQIMWKEIATILLVVYIIRLAIDLYIRTVYKKICDQFYSNIWDGLEEKIRKHLNICNVFSNGPLNKNVRRMYNGLCMALASILLVNNNEVAFVNQLHKIKNEYDFEMKSFALALYYYSLHDEAAAKKHYNEYLKCNHENKNINVIMEHLFSKENNTRSSDDIQAAMETFKNPAIVKLLKTGAVCQGDGSVDKLNVSRGRFPD